MGHLINPIAFRLGHFRSWEDTWYVRSVYYPEFLHGILKLRNYIYFHFKSKKMIKAGYGLCKLNIFKINSTLLVKIFIYHIELQRTSYKFINLLYASYYKAIRNKDFVPYKGFFDIHNSDVFVLIYLFILIFFSKIGISKIVRQKVLKLCLKDKKIEEIKISYTNEVLLFLENRNIENKQIEEVNKKSTKIIKKYLLKNKFNTLLLTKLSKLENFEFKNNEGISVEFSFFDFILYSCKKIEFQKFNNSFDFYKKWKSLLQFLAVFKFNKIYNEQENENFYNFFFIYMMSLWRTSVYSVKFNMRAMIHKHIYAWLVSKILYNYVFVLSNYFKILASIFTRINIVNFKYIFVSNKGVTAYFLTRYIALKLRNKYNLFRILNPIKRELNDISVKTRINKKVYTLIDYKLKLVVFMNEKKKAFLRFITNLSNLYKQMCFLYFIKFFTWISFDIFMYHNYISNKMFNTYKLFEKKVYIFKMQKRLIKKRKGNYLFVFLNIWNYLYFNYIFKYINLKFFVYFFNKFDNNILEFIKNYSFIENYVESFSYYYKLLNNSLMLNLKNYIEVKKEILLLSNIFFNNYFNFFFIKFLWKKFRGFNKRNIRNDYIIKYKSILMGYKMSFKGRFARKQRASCIWFHRGKVPLNTLNIDIDYNFITIPLKNSIVSIKLWLYKNKGITASTYMLKI